MRMTPDVFDMRYPVPIVLLLSLILAGCNTGGPEPASDDGPPSCRVRTVIDGDSILAECNGQRRQVRLYCIDAPEIKQRPWGEESRRALARLLRRNDRITLLIHDVDRYGRQVAEVIHDGMNANLEMVRSGNAAVYRHFCRLDAFYAAEKSARQARRGVWEKEGLHQAPWRWRHR
ncbi:MAG: thermonuclease family protein [Gammaproteobacteria bacterium]|jgi:endonuclease YncB( thermonuclease family)